MTAAGDSFQTGQTAKALQGYRVQSLPRGTPADGGVVDKRIVATPYKKNPAKTVER
jgi:hypothetical protein